jgi:hypothetical protein
MTIDIRAKVICDLGEVISGGWSDDHVQGTGLIRTRGEVVLKGILSPKFGQHVNLGYVKNIGGANYAVRMPRYLVVTGVFADPFRRQTTIQLGCPLTIKENYRGEKPEDRSVDTRTDPANGDYVCSVFNKATISISAAHVAATCIRRLGLSLASPLSLTNWFTVEEFDLSPGYVTVLSDLLISENLVGYINTNGALAIRGIGYSGTYTVIAEKDIIDIGPINSGQLPGDAVNVSYSYTRFKDPPDDDEEEGGEEKRNWELDVTAGPQEERSVELRSGAQYTTVITPRTEVGTQYDSFDRVVRRIEERTTRVIATNPSYIRSYVSDNIFGVQEGEDVERKVTEFVYETQAKDFDESPTPPPPGQCLPPSARKLFDPARDNVLLAQIETTYKSEMAVAGALGIPEYSGVVVVPRDPDPPLLDNWEYTPSIVPRIVTEIVTTTFTTDKESGVTKTVTTRRGAQAFTQSGQQVGATEAANIIEFGETGARVRQGIIDVIKRGQKLVNLGSVVSIRVDRTYGLQRRPSASELNNALSSKEFVEDAEETDFVFGIAGSSNVVTYRVPFSSDDQIAVGFDGKPRVTRTSDAPIKARAFARTQNLLAFGHRNGFSVQLAPDLIPAYPLSQLSVTAAGLTGAYICNGISWTFDSNGIVCNTDALLLGGVGTQN